MKSDILTILLVFFCGTISVFGQGNPGNETLDAGTISLDGDGFICTSETKPVNLSLQVSGKKGKSFTFLLTSEADIILELQKQAKFDFDHLSTGIYNIYHVSYDRKDFSAPIGAPIGEIQGTYDLSNSVEIEVGGVEPISISFQEGQDELSMCGIEEEIEIIIDGEQEENSLWLLTEKNDRIISVQDMLPLDFQNLDEDEIEIYNIQYIGVLTGYTVGNRLNKIDGCYAISNPLFLTLGQPEGGTIEGDTIRFCTGDNGPDKIHGNDLKLVGADKKSQSNTQWVLTDTSGIILLLPKNPHQPNFDDMESGICLIWHLAYRGEIEGLEIGANVEGLEGCFDFSNSLAIVKTQVNGGLLDHGIVKVCAESDSTVFIPQELFELSDTLGGQYFWVVTTRNKHILGYADTLDNIDLSESGEDKVFVYHLSYGDDMEGLEIGNRINELTGCFDFSNQVPVNIESAFGGTLEGEVMIACLSETEGVDSTGQCNLVLDTTNLVLSGEAGKKSTWLLTDADSVVIAISDDPSCFNVDLDELPETLLLWHISYAPGGFDLEVGGMLNQLEGCYGLSNSIEVMSEGIVDGGNLEGGPFVFCIAEGVDAFIEPGSIVLSENTGDTSRWVITDTLGNILKLPNTPEEVNFGQDSSGICLIWNISYQLGLEGLEIGNNVSELSGCFDFSNAIEVVKGQAEGGVLEGGPFEFCVGGLEGQFIPEDSITLTENSGMNFQWVITDTSGLILGLPDSPYEVDFNDAGPGICLIWHLAYTGEIEGLEIDSSANNIQGCFDFSNPIEVIRSGGNGGIITGGPFIFCVGDGVVDTIPTDSITLTDNEGSNSQWVITDIEGKILSLPATLSDIDFDGSEPDTCLIWHLSYDDGLLGLEIDSLVSDLEGCFDFSNSIEIIKGQPEGGTITGGPFGFCSNDPSLDTLEEGSIVLSDNMGGNSIWVVTDTLGMILAIDDNPYEIDYIGLGSGKCLIWHLSYEDGISGLEIGDNVESLEGCYDFSNSIEVFKDQSDGGNIEGGPFEFCVGDGIPDTIPNDLIILTGNTGANSQWVITDPDGIILGLPDSISQVNFDEAGDGECLIWHLAYDGDIEGLEVDSSVANLTGCYDFSNSISVLRFDPEGGVLDGETFNFCSGDDQPDIIPVDQVTLFDSNGPNQQWVITDTNGIIVFLSDSIQQVDFEDFEENILLVWNISFTDGLMGLELDNDVEGLEGCYDLSNSIIVNQSDVNGGEISFNDGSIDTTICLTDTIPDLLELVLNNESGDSSLWVITDTAGVVTTISDTIPLDFEGFSSGDYLIWHLSFNGEISGLEIDGPATNIAGCFNLSNSLQVSLLSGDECEDTSGLTQDPDLVLMARQNPVQDRLVIDMSSERIMGTGYLMVRDLEGHTVLSKTIKMVDLLNLTETISTENWENGMYFITLSFAGESRSIKIIKQE